MLKTHECDLKSSGILREIVSSCFMHVFFGLIDLDPCLVSLRREKTSKNGKKERKREEEKLVHFNLSDSHTHTPALTSLPSCLFLSLSGSTMIYSGHVLEKTKRESFFSFFSSLDEIFTRELAGIFSGFRLISAAHECDTVTVQKTLLIFFFVANMLN